MKTLISLIFTVALLAGCATGVKQHEKLQTLVKDGKFEDGLALVNSKDFYPDKNSELLKLLELGTLHYYNGNYFQAVTTFNQAQELSEKLFTVSMSKKALSAVTNDSLDNYYGEKYERSLIRLFQILSHLALSESNKYEAYKLVEKNEKGETKTKNVTAVTLDDTKRRFHLNASRSVLIEWNSLLNSYKATSGGNATYKDDLLAKLFGAFIHERLGTQNDLQIAKNLYIEAKNVLFKNYNIYRTYNAKNKEFNKKYDELHLMPEQDVKNNYTAETQSFKELAKYIDERIETFGSVNKHNVFFMISKGFVSPKVANKFDFPIPTDKIPASIPAGGNFVGFAAKVLKAGEGALPKIYFELPQINYEPSQDSYTIVVNDKNGKVIFEKSTALVEPVSDVAYQALDEKSFENTAKVGARVAGKHLSALAASYLLYEKQKGKSEMLAFMAASGAYAAANKGIEMSERADLRYWATLPSDFRLSSGSLPPGEYTVSLVKKDKEKNTLISNSKFQVKEKANKIVTLIAI